jgi:hypothetical protein
MKKTLILASTLALVMGTTAAFAQQGGAAEKSAPKVQSNSPATSGGAMPNGDAEQKGAAERSEPGKSTQRLELNRSQAQENRGRSETTGQAPKEQGRDEKTQGRDEKKQTTGQADERRVPNEKRNEGRGDEKRQTTSQAPNERREQTRDNDPKRNEGRIEERRENEKTDRTNTREDRRETTGQGAASGRSNVSVENRTKIHELIVKERSAPRVDHVDFNVSVGTVVPKTVRLVSVPSSIVTIEPSWRGYEYFLVGDQIIIVNPRNMEIVAVLDA